jgi:hypothetical protein
MDENVVGPKKTSSGDAIGSNSINTVWYAEKWS